MSVHQAKCGCWHSMKPSRKPWFWKPFSSYTRWSPVWIGNDEWCRYTLVIGWGFLGLMIIPVYSCRNRNGKCEVCGPHMLDGMYHHQPLSYAEAVQEAAR